MEKNNLLKIARDLEKKEEWVELYKILASYFDPEDNEWEELIEEYLDGVSAFDAGLLSLEERADLASMKIECIIKVIDLEAFYGGKDEEGNLVRSDECEEIGDLLDNAISYMAACCIYAGKESSKDQNTNTVENINKYRHQAHQWAKEHFMSVVDMYIDNVGSDARDGSLDRFWKFQNGFFCLNNDIFYGFLNIWSVLSESAGEDEIFPVPETDNKWLEEVNSYLCDRWYKKSLEFSEAISELTTDFPYYDNMDIAHMYNRAGILSRMALASPMLPIEPKEKVARLKHRINIQCDQLNAIIVKNDHRGTMLQAGKARNGIYNDILECEKQIQETEPDYKRPNISEPFSTIPEKGGGCYVATAVYGSYDCPEVWTLRRFRDYTLAETWYGRAFVKCYYAVSPTLVRWFGKSQWFKNMWKPKLDRMIADLQAKGFESTPYEDKKW